MVLTKGDINEIGDTMCSITEDMWEHIDDQYKSILTRVQQGLKYLQAQVSMIQASIFQVTKNQVSMETTSVTTTLPLRSK